MKPKSFAKFKEGESLWILNQTELRVFPKIIKEIRRSENYSKVKLGDLISTRVPNNGYHRLNIFTSYEDALKELIKQVRKEQEKLEIKINSLLADQERLSELLDIKIPIGDGNTIRFKNVFPLMDDLYFVDKASLEVKKTMLLKKPEIFIGKRPYDHRSFYLINTPVGSYPAFLNACCTFTREIYTTERGAVTELVRYARKKYKDTVNKTDKYIRRFYHLEKFLNENV